MSPTPQHCRLTVEEKLHILEKVQHSGIQIAGLCRWHGIATRQFRVAGRPREDAKAVLS